MKFKVGDEVRLRTMDVHRGESGVIVGIIERPRYGLMKSREPRYLYRVVVYSKKFGVCVETYSASQLKRFKPCQAKLLELTGVSKGRVP